MHLLTALVYCCLSLFSLSYAIPVESTSWGPYKVAETAHSIPTGWQLVGEANSNEILKLRIMLKSTSEKAIEEKLMRIGTPGHAEYGHHLSQEQVTSLVSPDIGSIRTLMMWITSFDGASKLEYSAATSAVSFQITVAAATEMLKADFGIYQSTNKETIIRALQYSLPEEISSLITLVHPITHFPTIKALRTAFKTEVLEARQITANLETRAADPALLAACTSITPGCIAKMYNINYTPPLNATPSGSSLAIAGFLEQYISHADITNFVSKYGNSAETRAHPGTFTVELVNGGTNNESAAGIEATLDMEYSMPFTGSLPVVYYSTGGRPPSLDASGELKPSDQSYNEPYLEWLEYMLTKPDGEIPQVISISYTDTEMGAPRSYATHVCSLFGRLAARGVSIINASGDGGVAGQEDFDCVSNDGLATPQFLPTFPASCPWVTAVGSTSVIPEQGSSFSSGGFSNYFATPTYQVNATDAYIAYLGGQYEGLYNKSGRGIPDVAIYGSRYETENNNVTSGHHSGTSAGTPVFAAMVALVNDVRLRRGEKVLGWLNPLLYSGELREVLNDVVDGNSYGCGEVWNATTGWDTVTGLGSVDFGRLMKVLG